MLNCTQETAGVFNLLRDTSEKNEFNAANIQEFENTILADSNTNAITLPPLFTHFISWFRFAWRKAFPNHSRPYCVSWPSYKSPAVSILLGPSFRRCAGFILNGKKAAYLFDATPPWASPETIAKFAIDAGITHLFVDHPEFIDPIREHTKELKIHCVPAGINPGSYSGNAVKDIDVLEFGRSHPLYHDALVEQLPGLGISHHFQRMETRAEFIDILSRSKIIACFPRSETDGEPEHKHPMLTMRYFQAMASNGLLVGSCPPLLRSLFGYDPVVKADFENPAIQIEEILRNYDDYKPLIRGNYETLIESHTFAHRWEFMKELITTE